MQVTEQELSTSVHAETTGHVYLFLLLLFAVALGFSQ